jgi:hypothetical protein
MTKGDFGFHSVWTNLPRFIKKLDIDAIKKKIDAEKKETEEKQSSEKQSDKKKDK